MTDEQPGTAEEIAAVRESPEGCGTEAIHDDSDQDGGNQKIPLQRRVTPKPDKATCCRDFSLDDGTTPTSIGGALFKTVLRWFKRN
ncbi:MAG: hypothetical protein ACJAVK_002988 [Akkermansiaceae bacterium]|jgi:hypothetical protein